MDIEEIILELEVDIETTLNIFLQELSKIHTGNIKTSIFDLIKINYYGAVVSLSHVSTIYIVNNKITIEPYEKSYIKVIEKALIESKLEFNPQINGSTINIYIPPMTLERRNKLSKFIKSLGEKSKISIRNLRRSSIKKIESFKLGEDLLSFKIKEIENLIEKSIIKIEQTIDLKNKEIYSL